MKQTFADLADLADLSQDTAVEPLHTRLPLISPRTARLARLTADARLAARLRRANLCSLQMATAPAAARCWQAKGSIGITHAAGDAQVSFDLANWPALQIIAADHHAAQTDRAADFVRSAAPATFNDEHEQDEQAIQSQSTLSVSGEIQPSLNALYEAITNHLLAPAAKWLHTFGLDKIHFGAVSAVAMRSESTSGLANVNANANKSGQSTRLDDFFVQYNTNTNTNANDRNNGLGAPIVLSIDHIDNALLACIEALINVEHVPISPQLLRIRVPGRAVLGKQRIKIDTLRSLRAGDILINGFAPHSHTLLDARPTLDSVELIWGALGVNGLFSTGSLAGNTIVIKDNPGMTEATEPTHSSANDLEETVDLAQLELPVRMEIDTVALPLAQLSSLRAGYVIELPVSVTEVPVRLVAHGQTIGFGELVAVGDKLGIRIQQMAKVDVSTD